MARKGKMTNELSQLDPRVIIEILGKHCSEKRLLRMQSVLSQRIESVAIGLEDLHHSHNAKACLRTAESLGVADVVAVELRDEYPLEDREPDQTRVNRKLSMHAHHWIDLHRLKHHDQLVKWARARGMKILGTSPHATQEVSDLNVSEPLLFLFGNEKEGLRPETVRACDGMFKLPMYGFTESFNLSVSVGMTLFNVMERKRAHLSLEGQSGDISTERQNELLARWLVRDIRGAALIVERALNELNERA